MLTNPILDSCVIISGLASHPFGSWQPRGSDKFSKWIRDDLFHPGFLE